MVSLLDPRSICPGSSPWARDHSHSPSLHKDIKHWLQGILRKTLQNAGWNLQWIIIQSMKSSDVPIRLMVRTVESGGYWDTFATLVNALVHIYFSWL